mmetsp:Transcript_108013/g.348644  ORF Transcript_108013/g.348644 Transcript_108013/m.348644 type:complete len:452 (-) Transcript_108013:1449-2804(-)
MSTMSDLMSRSRSTYTVTCSSCGTADAAAAGAGAGAASGRSRPIISRLVRPLSRSVSASAMMAALWPWRLTIFTWLRRVSPSRCMSARRTSATVLLAATVSWTLASDIAWVTVSVTSPGSNSGSLGGEASAFGSAFLASGFWGSALLGSGLLTLARSGAGSGLASGAVAGSSRPRKSSSVLPLSMSSSLRLEKPLPSSRTSLQELRARSSSFALMALRTSRIVALSRTVTTRDCGVSEAACTILTCISAPSLRSTPMSMRPCSTSSSTELSSMSSARVFSPEVESTMREAGPRPTFWTMASLSCLTSSSLEIVSVICWLGFSMCVIFACKSRVGFVVLQSSSSFWPAPPLASSSSSEEMRSAMPPSFRGGPLAFCASRSALRRCSSCHFPGGRCITGSVQRSIWSWNSFSKPFVSVASGTPLAPSQFSPGSGATWLCHQDSKRFWMMLDLW